MKAYEFAQQYYKKLADGESVNVVNHEVLLDGKTAYYASPIAFNDLADDRLSWKPKTITVTIPAPMTERPKVGDLVYIQDGDLVWSDTLTDSATFNDGPIWSTEKDRDEAMRILSGGKDEA